MPDKDLLSLLRGAIGSVAALELLLFLQSKAPAAWSAEQLVQELRSSPAQVEGSCARLAAAGFLRMEADRRYAYAPASETLDTMCRQIAEAYRQRPVSVISALFSGDERLRSFAEAFRIKGTDE